MNPLDTKITQHFAGLVVRKDLVKTVKGNAIVPSYVLEYLLGQYCATSDEPTIQTGIETVKEILAKHYVHRNEAGLVRSNIKEKGRYKVIDKISVDLNDKKDVYEAQFPTWVSKRCWLIRNGEAPPQALGRRRVVHC
jgi:ATP-dependent Lon protease